MEDRRVCFAVGGGLETGALGRGLARSGVCFRGGRWVMGAKKKGGGGGEAKKVRLSVKGFGKPAPKKGAEVSDLTLSRDQDIDDLYRWLKLGGASFGRVAVGEKAGRRGVFALETISEGDVICSIPKTLAIALGEQDIDPTQPANLLLTMMQEDSQPAQFFKPMLAVLPKEPDNKDSLVFSDAELDSLEQPEIKSEYRRREAQIDRSYEKFNFDAMYSGDMENPMGDGIKYSKDALRWGVFIIVSRALGVQNQDRELVKLLIPFIDMINHSNKALNELKFKKDSYNVIAGAKIEAGEEVFIRYGDGNLTNSQLLLDYRFVETDNENDQRGVLGGTLSKLKPGKEAVLLSSVEARLNSLKASPEEDDKILAKSESYTPKQVLCAQFRTEHRKAMESAAEELRRRAGLSA
uniref:SET domain-containing protein n=3 Tax=Rhodosorus marinus TaxID=101924 RepID=A0A7S2ZGC2_9RHOD|mmetsp:Transcript_18603/g.74810  ORF Transcript_18603/g.74810 Transcript_18603/m.74810 type:complete len:408 (+) Transcript_18603:492-1715(+)|eukprot:CAMPEP_0113960692 /NCGR_PEP_ID=MMETSP0011_2-20120614/4866_1 /TAXON_ID=101924 /ORGANISM="Rhodosorus marinus" /LENGTH=407 /DNA_ID=CAMNT_0000972193 /DNA_START=492 /DNA_END=1715 /DNA_ORIENTATION=+ /assembly_acc=CAM_ASM_000156